MTRKDKLELGAHSARAAFWRGPVAVAIRGVVAAACLCLCLLPITAAAQPPTVIDSTSLAGFEAFASDPQRVAAAEAVTVMFVDESVGANINDGLKKCLAYPTSYANTQPRTVAVSQFINQCLKWQHVVPAFNSPQSEVSWPGSFNPSNITYFVLGRGSNGLPGMACTNCSYWDGALQGFISHVDATADQPNSPLVYMLMLSYLHVTGASTIMHPTQGIFVPQANRADITDFQAAQARHPDKVLVLASPSLSRGQSAIAGEFATALRQWQGQPFLLDVANVESESPFGQPCFDNRDGVPYTSAGTENWPDDGISAEACCQHYTSEREGCHLGSASAGKIRQAKAFWLLLDAIALR